MAGTPPVTQFIQFVFEHYCRKIVNVIINLSLFLFIFDKFNISLVSKISIDRALELEEFESKIPFAN